MMYVDWPETLEIAYGEEVTVYLHENAVSAIYLEARCFPIVTEIDGVEREAFVIKCLVEFHNKERKWVFMEDVERIDEGQTN